MCDITNVEPPPPPEVGETNHFSTVLIWENALKEVNEKCKGNGMVKVKVERKDEVIGRTSTWNKCYTGMAKQVKFTDLEPKTTYHYRMAFEQKDKSTAFGPHVSVTTTREPLYAENLHMAIKKQNEQELVDVLKSGEVCPDVQNEDNFTALMAAAKKPFLEGMERLIEYGADVDFKNAAGKTALMIACVINQLDSVKLLLEHKAGLNLCDNGGCTAVHWAVDARSVKLIDLLGQHGADFNVRDGGSGGWTPLIRCANLHGDRDVGLALMMNGADINFTDNNGSTALHHAVNRKHFELTEILLKRKADPLLANKEATTPWSIANSHDDKSRIAKLMQPYVENIKAERKKIAVKNAAKNTGTASSPDTSNASMTNSVPATPPAVKSAAKAVISPVQ